MILSNVAILKGIKAGYFSIGNLTGDENPLEVKPFNTSAIDLAISDIFSVPRAQHPGIIDTRNKINSATLAHYYEAVSLPKGQPFTLYPNKFLLGQTIERVHFPYRTTGPNFSARVEGKSSLARCGLLVHFTAPTIHAGFNGPIALEIINLGSAPISLNPGAYVCQLIIEQVEGEIAESGNQFSNQRNPIGERAT